MEEAKTIQRRVRVNLSQTAKGLIQIDCTAESENPEEIERLLSDAVEDARKVIKAKGLTEVSA